MLKAEEYMLEALAEARRDPGEVPVGAVVVHDGRIIARAHNERGETQPFAHAEILAMERAARALGRRRLHGCTLYVTLEPCPLCAGGLILAQADACVFGAYDEKQGCCGSVYTLPEDPAFSHRVRCTGGVMAAECAALLPAFFRGKRT
ncbi:MAG: nucleoside deaminase [Clostridiales bacterium]|nr:nucleoside deaminase [Clostridiales bacterium]